MNDYSNGQHNRVKKSQYSMRNEDPDTKYETTSPYTAYLLPVTKFTLPVTHNKQRALTSTKKRKFRNFFNLFKSHKSHKKSEKTSKPKRHLDARVTRFCPFKKLRYWLTCNTKRDNLMVSSTMKSDINLYKSEIHNGMEEIGDQMSNMSVYKIKPSEEVDYSVSPNDNYVFDWNDVPKDLSPQLDSIDDIQSKYSIYLIK